MIITMTGFTVAFVVPRLTYKQFFSARKRLDIEDWTLISALAIGLPTVALTIFGLTAHGMGTDLWGLERANLIAFGRYFYVIQILYILLMAFVKLTLTFFYLNIFFGRAIRALLWGTAVFHVAGAVAFSIGIIFQCLPISYQWEKFNYINNNAVQGHCININAAGWANAAISVASDIWLLAIPLSQIHKLQLHWKKKLGAALMFLTGASVTVISFLRLASVRNYASTSNPTWDHWDIVWWSTIEVEVGLICTCLPAMRLIFVRLAPRIFGSELSHASLHLNRVPSKSTGPIRDDEDEEATLPKRSSAPAAPGLDPVLKYPEPVLYDYHNGSNTSMSIGGGESHDGWHDQVPLRAIRKPEKWRSSAPS
ncbi:hypothetical protein NLG97_g4219 [Lecanicillium saksenae]|uniref:Uncharacterized protein n=1 Tax=Lecanicillium saksenae TaxID=468837 RepID=A0ACC1QXM1_9HYPO|nr:hypothetical protein NLG97_g4219 [Lecanicillium saksenae]